MTRSSIVPQANEEQTRSTMMAWRVHEFGPPEIMKFERISRPEPGPGEVLVKVEAAGVGPWDGWIRAGKSALPHRPISRQLPAAGLEIDRELSDDDAASSRCCEGSDGLLSGNDVWLS